MKRVLALLVGVSVVTGCTGASAPSSPPSAAASTTGSFVPVVTPSAPTPRPTPTPAPPTPASGLHFEQVATVEGTELYTAAASGDGFLVGGCRLRPPSDGSAGGCAEARILRSTDGRSWTDAVMTGAADREVRGIADTPLGLLAIGSIEAVDAPLTRSVWRSIDGTRWEPFVLPAPESIVFSWTYVLAGRTVLIGEDTTDGGIPGEFVAWATSDGRTWSNGIAPLSHMVVGDGELVAIGDECVDLCPSILPIHVRRSRDGLAWTEDEPDAALAEAHLSAIGSWSGRAVAGGVLGDGPAREATVWFDEPGGWRRVRLEGGRGYDVDALFAAGAQLLAIGRAFTDDASRAWWTADGRTWESGVPDSIWDGYPIAWAGGDPLLVVVDFRSIWLSSY